MIQILDNSQLYVRFAVVLHALLFTTYSSTLTKQNYGRDQNVFLINFIEGFDKRKATIATTPESTLLPVFIFEQIYVITEILHLLQN